MEVTFGSQLRLLGYEVRPVQCDANAGLPASGILIVASGNLTHNLRDYQTAHRDKTSPAYVAHFAEWIAERVSALRRRAQPAEPAQ